MAYRHRENCNNLAVAGLLDTAMSGGNAGMRYLLGRSLVLRVLLFRPDQGLGRRSARFQPIGRNRRVNNPGDRDEIYKQIIADLRGGCELCRLAQRRVPGRAP